MCSIGAVSSMLYIFSPALLRPRLNLCISATRTGWHSAWQQGATLKKRHTRQRNESPPVLTHAALESYTLRLSNPMNSKLWTDNFLYVLTRGFCRRSAVRSCSGNSPGGGTHDATCSSEGPRIAAHNRIVIIIKYHSRYIQIRIRCICIYIYIYIFIYIYIYIVYIYIYSHIYIYL